MHISGVSIVATVGLNCLVHCSRAKRVSLKTAEVGRQAWLHIETHVSKWILNAVKFTQEI